VTAAQSFALTAKAANSDEVGTVLATDADTGTTYQSWTITSGNNDGIFQIDANAGAITVLNNTNLGNTTGYTLGVTVSDGTNTSAVENVTVNITDIDGIVPVIESSEPEPEDLPASTDNEAVADSISTDRAVDLQTNILILGDSDMGTPQAAAGIFSDTGPASPASKTSKPNESKTAIFRAADLQTNILRADNLITGTLLAEKQGPDTPKHDGFKSNRPGMMDDSGKDEMYHFLKDKLASRHVSPNILLDNQEMWHEMDSLKEQMKTVGKAQELRKVITIGATAGLATVTTAGYLIWAAQGGSLLTGLLPSVPMWNFVDPLQALNPGAAGGPGNKAEWLKKGLRVLRRKA
jgi:hypothetical protein